MKKKGRGIAFTSSPMSLPSRLSQLRFPYQIISLLFVPGGSVWGVGEGWNRVGGSLFLPSPGYIVILASSFSSLFHYVPLTTILPKQWLQVVGKSWWKRFSYDTSFRHPKLTPQQQSQQNTAATTALRTALTAIAQKQHTDPASDHSSTRPHTRN